jgi:hypothetical protein
MKSLLWKECRENLKWVAVPVLLYGGLIGLMGHSPFMAKETLILYSMAAAVFGAVLGFLQVFFESQGDRRALLLHRPLSHSHIFLGKTIAGLGLMGWPWASPSPGRSAGPLPRDTFPNPSTGG